MITISTSRGQMTCPRHNFDHRIGRYVVPCMACQPVKRPAQKGQSK